MEKRYLDIKLIGEHGSGKSIIGLSIFKLLAQMGFEVNFREQINDGTQIINLENNQEILDHLKDVIVIDIEEKFIHSGLERDISKSEIKYSAHNGKW